MKKFIKENKKLIIGAIIIIMFYTIHSYYINAELKQVRAELLQEKKPSFADSQTTKIDNLYQKRLEIISNTERMQEAILSNDELKYKTESMIRCEKENTFKKEWLNGTIADCEYYWAEYPKK